MSYLFEADAGEVPQDSFHRVGQLSLAQRILLSPDDVNVVWDVIGSVVSRFALALTLKPRADVVGRTGVSCRWKACICCAVAHISRIFKRTQMCTMLAALPMFQVPTNTVIMSGSSFSECLFFIC